MSRLRRGVVEAHLRRVARRHHHRVHAIGAERIDGDRQRQRRIDAAGQPEHDAGEAMLADVVAHAEHERAVDARFFGQRRLDVPRPRHRRAVDEIDIDRKESFLERRRALHDLARARS